MLSNKILIRKVMNTSKTYRLNVKRLVLAFSVVLILIGAAMSFSVNTVSGVSTKAEQLVNSHIPDLKDISDLQNVMGKLIINLHQYYATLENKYYEENKKLIEEFKVSLTTIFKANNNQTAVNLNEHLEKFETNSNNFHSEMSLGRDRDWDVLREHLHSSEVHATAVTNILTLLSKQIRQNVYEDSMLTLDEVSQLNKLQIGINIVVLLVTLFIVFNLYLRIKDQAALYKQAYHNDITGLPNRHYFEDAVSKELASNENNYALLLLNLDRFKLVNETFGYIVGDKLLQTISTWIVKELDKKQKPYKLFQFTSTSWLVLFPQCSEENKSRVSSIANSLLRMSSVPMHLEDRELSSSCSIGISFSSEKEENVIDVLRHADAALRSAEQSGGDCFRFYTEKMSAETKNWLDTEHALRYAIENQEFELFYQPKINPATNKIAGSEALIRWKRGEDYVSPGVFIPIAEKSGLIVRIGDWVLFEACRQWVQWQKEGLPELPVAVNISAQQFQDPDFNATVQSALIETGMPASMLELEITEEAAAADPKRVVQIMHELKKTGVSLAIDDFGTGYSSLSYLKRFPIDTLKIDQSFVREMEKSDKDVSIIKLILDLAKQLDFKVVAEGIETERQHHQLRRWGCDLMQGFLFSKPIIASEFSKLIYQDLNNSNIKQLRI